MAEKMGVGIKKSPAYRGCEWPGVQTLDLGSPPDLKEDFIFGIDRGPEHPTVACVDCRIRPCLSCLRSRGRRRVCDSKRSRAVS